jgi:DNA-binding transcriptional MocR family regulator
MAVRIRGRTAAAVARSIEDALQAGQLPPGEALPPVRQLAGSLALSPATVAAAYRVLRRRGFLTGTGRAGTRVAAGFPVPAGRRPARAMADAADLASGNPDPELLPALDAALRAVAAAPSLYGAEPELPALMRFLAAEFAADGIPAAAITLVNGALDALERTLRAHLRPGDAVAVEDPTLPALLDLLAASGYRRIPVAVDDEGPRPDAFQQALRVAAAVVITPRAQNPTGAALPATRARELRRLLHKRPRVLLVESDPCGPIAGVPCESVVGAGLKTGPSTSGPSRSAPEAWVHIRSMSKFLGPDLRVAAVAGDARTVARVEGRYALGPRWISTILQQLALALWADPSSARTLARAADVYAQRRRALLQALQAHGITAHGRSGLNVWIPVRHEGPIVSGLADAGWAVAAGERFRLRAAPGIRVTTATLAPADAIRFAADLAALTPMGSARAAAY